MADTLHERCHCHTGCGGDGWAWADRALPGSTPRDPKGVTVYCACPAGAELATKEQGLSGLEAAWIRAFAGCMYGEEETASARHWFEEGYRAGQADMERPAVARLVEEARLYLTNRDKGWGFNGLEKALEELDREVSNG